jgi:succinoglycan biosynthesis transport protein ExoP
MLPETKTTMPELDDSNMLLRNLLWVLRKRIWIIVLSAVALTGAGVGLSFLQTPTYEASIKVLVGQKSGTDAPVDVFALQQLTQTVVEAATTRPVADAVIQRLDLQMTPKTLLANLDAQQVKATQFVEISYTDTDPERAQRVADAVGQVLSDRMSEINAGDATLTAKVWEPATLPSSPTSPNPIRNGVVALVAGVLLGAMLAFLLEYFDDTWRSSAELERLSGKPNLGVLPKAGNPEVGSRKIRWQAKAQDKTSTVLSRSLVTALEPTSALAEAYRTLRTNLFYSFVDDPPKTIALSSAGRAEGKTFVCANLGVVLAQAGKSTLVMDCDLRQPSMHKVFGVHNSFGVVDFVAGQRSWQEILHQPLEGLQVITAGTLPPDPVSLLSSQQFIELLTHVSKEFDYVLLDTAPTKAGSDAAIVTRHGDGALLVVDAQSTRKWVLRQSISGLETVGARVLGTVLNRVEPQGKEKYYDYSA